jgi:hypothetical protein
MLGAAAAETPKVDDFVGTWMRTWPRDACGVAVEIRADGTMTIKDGERQLDARLAVTGGPDDQGFVAVAHTETQDNGGVACTTGVGEAASAPPDGGPKRHLKARRSSLQAFQDILPFAHGDAMALCRFDNLGGCDDWFSRVPATPPRPVPPPRHDLVGAVERQLYALIPEDRAGFELVASTGTGGAMFPDRDAPGGFRPVACEHKAQFTVVGQGATGLFFVVSSCSDATTIENLAARLVKSDLATASDVPAAERLRYGLTTVDRPQRDGSRLLYVSDEVHGVDSGTLVKIAVHIDARRRRAIMVMGVDMETLTGPKPPFARNPMYHDPAAIMQALVERLARDPDSAR